jgi:hypothetical protein
MVDIIYTLGWFVQNMALNISGAFFFSSVAHVRVPGPIVERFGFS